MIMRWPLSQFYKSLGIPLYCWSKPAKTSTKLNKLTNLSVIFIGFYGIKIQYIYFPLLEIYKIHICANEINENMN